jgi:hypothetical protein
MMKLTLKEAVDLLEKEVQWCLEHPELEVSEDARVGFINGLRQAQLLLQKAEKVINANV